MKTKEIKGTNKHQTNMKIKSTENKHMNEKQHEQLML